MWVFRVHVISAQAGAPELGRSANQRSYRAPPCIVLHLGDRGSSRSEWWSIAPRRLAARRRVLQLSSAGSLGTRQPNHSVQRMRLARTDMESRLGWDRHF